MMRLLEGHPPPRLVEYDSIRRRLWILGQRCHHGATGSLLAAVGCAGLAVATPVATAKASAARSMLALAATGGALMAHDWHDRTIWFERGYGTQP
jgi:hypothetical protein